MVKSRINYARAIIRIVQVLILIGIILSYVFPVSLASPVITRSSVTPRSGDPSDKFVFLVTYTSPENKPPEYVRLVMNDKKFDLIPVNDDDLNYSDGKDYTTRQKFSEGTHVYYFEVSDGNESTSSRATTLSVEPENMFTHLDVAYSLLFATFIILIPMIYGLYQLRRISNSLNKLTGVNEPKTKKKRND